MSLTIQERIKDLRVERRLTLKELEEQTGLSSSALGSYEADDTKDISHYALIKLAKFYGVTVDYLLGLRACLKSPGTPSEPVFSRPAALKMLGIHPVFLRFFPCRAKKSRPIRRTWRF